MTTQEWFFLWGTFFFISWFVFLIVMTVAMILMLKQVKEMRQSLEDRAEKIQAMVEEKLNQPSVTAMMTLAPLLPPLMALGRRLLKRPR